MLTKLALVSFSILCLSLAYLAVLQRPVGWLRLRWLAAHRQRAHWTCSG
jgi:hypothetical protein